MNIKIVLYFLGWVLNIEAVFMLLPCLVALIYGETSGIYFLETSAVCAILGWIMSHKRPSNSIFYAREGFVSVALSWIVLSFFGAMPFYISGEIPIFENALFEVISGFTTTGASALPTIEHLSKCMLIWRCFTNWIGGMGVLVFLLAVLPLAGGYNMHIMRAESPGPSVGKLVPKVKSTAKILYIIYFAMTLVQFIVLLLTGMPWFDSLSITFATAGTGGFGVLNDSMTSYTILQQAVVTFFMILFGINFNVYYLFLMKKTRDALRSEEMRYYLMFLFISILLITWNVKEQFSSLMEAFHHSAFQAAAIITTTGFSTVDFINWPSFSKSILLILMFIGGCAGSTAGGMKVSRIVIAVKTVKKELSAMIHPRSVKVLKFEGKTIEHTVLRTINIYFIAYFLILFLSILALSIENLDLTTNLSAVLTTLNNVGLGLMQVGPNDYFGFLSAFSKYVLMFDMLAGRLEIFPMLLLFSPKTWMKNQ
ncbi:MAG: TrkH family potassium uptake protein [Lachnospiraceae bacterium]